MALMAMCEHKRVVKMSFHHADCFSMIMPDGSDYQGYGINGGDDTQVHLCLDCGEVVGGLDMVALRAFVRSKERVNEAKRLNACFDEVE